MTDPKALLNARGLRPNKSLGQNFLTSRQVVDAVISAVNPSDNDTILEIGPGLGALTLPLAREANQVIAVELDKTLAGVLDAELKKEEHTNVEISIGDFMRLNIVPPPYCKVVAALPYYITTPAIRKLYTLDPRPKSITLIIQKEAAEKLTASPGGDNYGILTLETAYYAKVGTICEAPPDCFYPQPGVHSRAIFLEMLEEPPVMSNKAHLFRVITAAFSTRRKTLLNCLSAGLNIPRREVSEIIEKCGFPPDIRGERLNLFDYDKLTQVFSENM